MFRKRSPLHHLFPIHQDSAESLASFDDDGFIENLTKGERRFENQSNRSFVGPVISLNRYRMGMWLVIGLIAVIGLRVGSMQIAQGAEYQAQAESNRYRTIITPADRGIITDRNGLVLAENTPVFQLVLTPSQLPKDQAERSKILTALNTRFAIDPSILSTYTDTYIYDPSPTLLSESFSYEHALAFTADSDLYPGVTLEQTSKRSYITYAIPSLSHVIGYTGAISEEEYEELKALSYRGFDRIGKQGIEKQYEQALRGSFGRTVIEINASGRERQIITQEEPVAGTDLALTIDAGLQAKTEQILEARMAGTPATKASVVIMDPRNGDILTLVSWPAYDANLFPNGDADAYAKLLEDDRHPLFPRATAGEAPAGSTIKTVFAAAALIEGIITPNTTVVSSGGIQVGPWFFPDWRGGGHGVTDVYHAIADSVNTFFYYVGGGYNDFEGLGVERLMSYARTFGFASTTGVDLPGEADGFLPSMEWKERVKGERWYIGDTYNVSIGQGDILVTPLQMARATAVFANGGYLVTPQLVHDSDDQGTSIIPEETASEIASAMRQTVTNGSATSLQSVPVAVAGKTGTAQWSSTRPNHSWFTGFAPYENPELVITVLIEEGGDTGVAIPVTRDILNYWFATSP